MKRAKRFFAVTLVLVVASVQCALAGGSLSNFLYYNKNDVFKTVSRIAHPGNNFQYASYNIYGDDIYATIHSKGKFSGWDYTMEVRIHKSGSKFDYLEVISDDDIAPAFMFSDFAKGLLNELFKDYHSRFLSFVENMYGERLYDMNARRMCLAYLSFKYWLN